MRGSRVSRRPIAQIVELTASLYSIFTLRRKDALKTANITHVLSVLRLPLDDQLFSDFKHMVVEVDDVEDEDLLAHFDACNQFIQTGLDNGGGVLVHWCVFTSLLGLALSFLLGIFLYLYFHLSTVTQVSLTPRKSYHSKERERERGIYIYMFLYVFLSLANEQLSEQD